jgi:alpha-tubulin suppressor-like RCC1 family protein
LPWWAYSIDGSEPWWIDCAQFDCTNLLVAPTNLISGVTAYGVVLTKNLSTGDTTLRPLGSTDVVATAAAPTGFVPGSDPEDAATWTFYQQILACPDCYGFDGEVPPPEIKLNAFLANATDYTTYATYESNLDAEVEAQAATATSAMNPGGGFMAMDDDADDGGGDPCVLTNLLQSFFVTNIVHNATGSTTITWESCQFLRYLVFTASSLSTNTQWIPQAYVWGQTNASWTSWTDTATTNDDGSTITERFYRVQRTLGIPIAAGGGHSLAATTNGVLWAWGSDIEGQLGDGGDTNIFSPEEVSSNGCNPESISNVQAAGAGYDYSVAVDAHGVVWSWGDGGSGALGNGAYTNILTPSAINGLSNIVSVTAGFEDTLALRADGTVWAWGSDTFGPFGVGYGALGVGYDPSGGTTNSPLQSMIPTGTNIVAIADGGGFSLALDTSGRVWGWGDNYYGQIGAGVPTGVTDMELSQGTNLPVLIPGISNVIAIAAGDAHSIALTSDKRVWTWGSDSSGQLGWNGNPSGANPTNTPVSGLSNVVAIAGGAGFTLAVTSNGQVYAWGDNSYGELGTNTSAVASTNLPMLVAGISNAVLVAASFADMYESEFALAVTVNHGTNQYWAWGRDDDGEIGNGTNVAAVYTPAGPLPFIHYNPCGPCVQLGTNGSFTATATGTLFLFLNDESGQFGDNSGSYTATVDGVASQIVVYANNNLGVAIGTVTNGDVYTYSAGGICFHCDTGDQCPTDANGTDLDTGHLWDCTGDPPDFICPGLQCESLVGKIE